MDDKRLQYFIDNLPSNRKQTITEPVPLLLQTPYNPNATQQRTITKPAAPVTVSPSISENPLYKQFVSKLPAVKKQPAPQVIDTRQSRDDALDRFSVSPKIVENSTDEQRAKLLSSFIKEMSEKLSAMPKLKDRVNSYVSEKAPTKLYEQSFTDILTNPANIFKLSSLVVNPQTSLINTAIDKVEDKTGKAKVIVEYAGKALWDFSTKTIPKTFWTISRDVVERGQLPSSTDVYPTALVLASRLASGETEEKILSLAERIQKSEVPVANAMMDLADFNPLKQNANTLLKDLPNKLLKQFFKEEKTKDTVTKMLVSNIDGINEELQKRNEDIATSPYPFLASVSYNMTSGLSSLALAVGTTMATKSTNAGALLLSATEGSDTYNEYRDAGYSPERAHSEALLKTAGIFTLEKIGLDYFFKTLDGGGFVKRAISRFITEGTQEGTQAFFSNLMDKTGRDSEQLLLEGLLLSFIYGGLIGALGGMAFDYMAGRPLPKTEDGNKVRLVQDKVVNHLVEDFSRKVADVKRYGETISQDKANKIAEDIKKINIKNVTSEADIFHRLRVALDKNGIDINKNPGILDGLKGSVDNIGANYAAFYEMMTGETIKENALNISPEKGKAMQEKGFPEIIKKTTLDKIKKDAIKNLVDKFGINNDLASDLFMMQGKFLQKSMPSLMDKLKEKYSPMLKETWETLKNDQRGFLQLPSLFTEKAKEAFGFRKFKEDREARDAAEYEAEKAKSELEATKIRAQIEEAKTKGVSEKKIAKMEKKLADIENEYYELDVPEETRLQLLQRNLQDKANRLGVLVKTIEKKEGSKIPDKLNVRQANVLFPGASKYQLDEYQETVVNPLLIKMAEMQLTLDEFTLYAYAKHAGERNAKMLEAFGKKDGSGMSNKDAKGMLDKFNEQGKTEKLESVRQFFAENVTNARLELLSKDFLKKEDYENLKNTYKNYVSLKGKDGIKTLRSAGRGFSVEGKDIRRAFGRESLAEMPVVYDLMDYETTLVRIAKNEVAKRWLDAALKYPDKNVWEVRKEQFMPRYNKDGEIDFVESLDKNIKDNELVVMKEGEKYIVTLKDEAMVNAVKSKSTIEANEYINKITNVIRAMNSYIRLINTAYAPSFILVNPIRDAQTAGINMVAKEGEAMAMRMLKETPSSIRGIFRQVRGKNVSVEGNLKEIASKDKLTKDEWSFLYESLSKLGGKTGYFDFKTLDQTHDDLVKKMKNYNKNQTVENRKLFFTSIGKLIMDTNESTEMGVRLSAFRQMIKRGATPEQAATFAKELTINFNVKGNIAPIVELLHLFYSVGMSGTALTFSLLKSRKVQAIAFMLTLLGALWPELMRMLDEDEWDKLQEYEKERSLNFVIPGEEHEGYSLPLAYGFNVFYYFGDNINSVIRKKKTMISAAKDSVGSMVNAFVPLGTGSVLQFLSPTIADPLVQYIENKSWTGAPIKKEQLPYDKKRNSLMYFNSVSETSKEFTEWLNKISGGSEARPGLIDINPEMIDHFIASYSGSLGTDINLTVNAAKKIVNGEIPEAAKLPVLRRFTRTQKDYIYETRIYDVKEKSELHYLADVDKNKLKNSLTKEVEEGRMSSEKANELYAEVMDNQDKLVASDAFTDIENTKTRELKEGIYNSLTDEQKFEYLDIKKKTEVRRAVEAIKKAEKKEDKEKIYNALSDEVKIEVAKKFKK